MKTADTLTRFEIWHKDFNLDRKHNLDELPAEEAVFGIFAIVNDEPVNCRYTGYTENLRIAITELFEKPGSEGLKKFMQGAWIQMVVYEPMPGSSAEEREKILGDWTRKHKPAIDEEGEYPGYYEY